MRRQHGGPGWAYRLRLGFDGRRLAERYPYRWWVLGAAVLAVAVLVAVVVHVATPDRRPTAQQTAGPPSAALSIAPTSAAAPTSPAAGTRAAGLEGCVDATVSRLDLDGQVGQLLMIGTPIANPGNLADTVQRYRLGGVFLAGRTSQPAAALHSGIRTLQAAAGAIPLQVAVDQEGGEVQTLKGADFPAIPTAVEQGRWDQATLRARTADWAGRVAGAGITLDLAPVADTVPTDVGAANPPIGAFDRQYGSTPDAVAADVATVVSAARASGLGTTLKHFPGLGRVRANTDTSTNAVDAVTTVDDPYLRPFVSGIEAGTTAVMISSATYPKLDPSSVAAFSQPVVTGLLRQRLGYKGLVVSDDLGAAVAVKAVPVGERAVRFVRAGGDLVLTIRPADAAPMAAALRAAAQGSPAFAAQVTGAARDVVRSKYRAGLLSCPTG